jgi:hypothetical protein
MSEEFFLAVKERPITATIASLRDSLDQRVIDQSSIERLVIEFYQTLYSTPDSYELHTEAENVILAQVPCSFPANFSVEVLTQLGQSPTAGELKAALDAMAIGRSLGSDGVLTEFYSKFWDTIGEDFTHMIHQAIQDWRLPPGMMWGLIALLPKDGNREYLSNWRPITLLNSSYKILAKVLQIRLQVLLPDIIHDDQSAFLPLRFILDNVLI